jgi:hypothetical protein
MDPHFCGLYQQYEPYGYRLLPSHTEEYVYSFPKESPRRLKLVSNRHGFRGRRELDEPDKRPRIVVLGDSFVLGDGVEDTERFTDVLEALEPLWRVDNLGMTGWGPDLMLRALEQVGLALGPDAVVFSFYTDDFRRVHPHFIGLGFPTPRYVLKSGQLVTISYPKHRFWHRSRFFWAINRAYWKYSEAEWELIEAILDRFVELSDVYGFLPVIIFLPGTCDCPSDKVRRTWLGQYAKRHGTPFLDLTASIHKPRRERAVFIKGNPHYNPYGHRIIAENVRHFLKTRLQNSR